MNSPAARPQWAVGLAWAALAALIVAANASKGLIHQVQGWGVVYWWLDYGDGMVRRGLAGQLFQMVFGTLSPQGLVKPVMALHLLCVGGLAIVMLWLSAVVMARLRGRERAVFAAIVIWLLVSQFWPTLTYNVGYLDPLVLVLALAAALAYRRGWTLPAAAAMIAGPLVHEYFMFLIPFVLAAGAKEITPPAVIDELLPLDVEPTLNARPWRPVLLAGLAALSGAAVVALSKPPAALAQLAAMPVSEAQKQTLMQTTLGQSIVQAMNGMVELFMAQTPYALGNFAFFLLPALAAALGLLFWKTPRHTPVPVAKVAAGLFPIAALLLAWDLSRLLTITTFTTGVLFLLAAETRTRPDA